MIFNFVDDVTHQIRELALCYNTLSVHFNGSTVCDKVVTCLIKHDRIPNIRSLLSQLNMKWDHKGFCKYTSSAMSLSALNK